jgi:hypothetical protein
MIRSFIVATLIATAAAPAVSGGHAIALRVTPLVGFSPVDVAAVLTIEPRPENRSAGLTIYCDGEYVTGSAWPLDGDRALKTQRKSYARLPLDGSCSFRANVTTAAGIRSEALATGIYEARR